MVPKIVFIVPYRDRPQHKCVFERNMTHIMEDYDKNDYKIFFSEQREDGRPFNRGAIKNIGFLAVKNLYPDHYKNITFVFNDVDCFPYRKGLLNFQTSRGVIKHFFGFKHVLGGIFSITGSDFERIKGFPNFWTWGYEDNMIYNKSVRDPEIIIDRSTFFPIYDNNIVHMVDSFKKLINLKQSGNDRTEQTFNNISSIVSLNYEIVGNIIKIKTFNIKLPYKEEIVPHDWKATENFKHVKKQYTRFRGRMPMQFGKK